MTPARLFTFALILLTGLIGALLYPSLPDQVASHWNAAGEADGYMGRFWGVFLFPVLMAGMFLLSLVVPKVDPLKRNIELFRHAYDLFWTAMTAFLAYMFALAMAWNLGYRFSFTVAIVPACSVLLFCTGLLLKNARRNWFFGIRTPWTLSSDVVWEKTHALGSRLLRTAAVLSLVAVVVADARWAIGVLVVPTAAAVLATVVYSYVEYGRLSSR